MNIICEDIELNLDRQETTFLRDWLGTNIIFTQFGTINITKFINKQKITS